MLKFVTAIEYSPKGIFKNTARANQFNCGQDKTLHLYSLRTTLSVEQFNRVFFAPDGDGAYLEKCCGKGNVYLNPTMGPFFALQGIVGKTRKRDSLLEQYNSIEKEEEWDRDIYKPTMLFSLEEIEKYALNPFKTILIRNFGEVDVHSIHSFKSVVEEFFSSPAQRAHYIHVEDSEFVGHYAL